MRMRMLVGFVLFATILGVVSGVEEKSIIGSINATIKYQHSDSSITTSKQSICFIYDPNWKELTSSSTTTKLEVVFAEPMVGCTVNENANISNGDSFKGKAVVFQRGDCFFSTKILAAASLGAKAVIIASAEDPVEPIAANISDYSLVNITVVMVNEKEIASWKDASSVEVSFTLIDESNTFNPLVLIFLGFAMFCLVCASIWTTSTLKKEQNLKRKEIDQDSHSITVKQTIFLLGFACGFILIVYFFYKYVVYFMIGIFFVGGFASMVRIMHLSKSLFPSWCASHVYCDTKVTGKISIFDISIACIALAVSVAWIIIRNEKNAWVLQDIMALAFIISTLQILRTSSFKVNFILLSLFAVYDVFFVFITPLLTHNHDSVMVTAATGGGSSSETIPLTLRLPNFSHSCFGNDSMLGFGDIVLPGICVMFAAIYDLNRSHHTLNFHNFFTRNLYWTVAMCAYAFGLSLTFVALVTMETAQPALLYLSPSLLIALSVTALVRGEFLDFWHGKRSVSSNKTAAYTTLQNVLSDIEGDTDLSEFELEADTFNDDEVVIGIHLDKN
eukprot:m.6979 g.6979  ORF g.6979 m.6979 type:complete len:560 (-) comp2687_c0_seq1:401-2080(-)